MENAKIKIERSIVPEGYIATDSDNNFLAGSMVSREDCMARAIHIVHCRVEPWRSHLQNKLDGIYCGECNYKVSE